MASEKDFAKFCKASRLTRSGSYKVLAQHPIDGAMPGWQSCLVSAVALAERICGEADRLDPTGMF
jgi:hypothetical protein